MKPTICQSCRYRKGEPRADGKYLCRYCAGVESRRKLKAEREARIREAVR